MLRKTIHGTLEIRTASFQQLPQACMTAWPAKLTSIPSILYMIALQEGADMLV
jgi:hypothetical protein